MNIDKYMQKRFWIFSLSFVFILLLTIGSSYAITSNAASDVAKKIGSLHVTFKNSEKAEGTANFSATNIIIENKIAYKSPYSIIITSLLEEDSIDLNKVYYRINNGKPRILGKAEDGIILSDYINPRSSLEFELSVWIAPELIDNTDQGKKLSLNYEVVNK